MVLDMTLPDSHWERTLQLLPDFARAAPVMVVTGTGSSSVTQRCFEAGASAYVGKLNPEFYGTLCRRLKAMLMQARFATATEVAA